MRPKQLVPFQGGASLLARTVERLDPLVEPDSVWIVTTRQLADLVRRELPQVPPEQVLGEPVARNTGAAIGWAVSSMPAAHLDRVIAVLPSDHWVADAPGFRRSLAQAAAAVAEEEDEDRVLALGVKPRWAETGYGYLELGETIDRATGLARVARFTEKPGHEEAQEFFASGRHWWNAGIFLFRGRTLLNLLKRHQPELAAGLAALRQRPQEAAQIYARFPKEPIDTAVMEHLENEILTLPLDCGWNDLGSWQALAAILPDDRQGNRVYGDLVAVESSSNVVYADAGTVALIGVEGLVVVRAADCVLVLPAARAQDVRALVDELAARKRHELL